MYPYFFFEKHVDLFIFNILKDDESEIRADKKKRPMNDNR